MRHLLLKSNHMVQCQSIEELGYEGTSGADHFYVPSKHSCQISTDRTIDTLTLTRIQPGHHNVMSRRSSSVYSVGFVSHLAVVRAIVKDMSSLLVFIISAVWILDTSIPIPVSHLTWVLQFPRAWETQCCFDFGWTYQDIVNQG